MRGIGQQGEYPITSTNAAAKDVLFGYTARAFEETTGLQNNLNRWLDAASGKWLSEDPISFNGGDANLARYVGNHPTVATDPSGLETQLSEVLKIYKLIYGEDDPYLKAFQMNKGNSIVMTDLLGDHDLDLIWFTTEYIIQLEEDEPNALVLAFYLREELMNALGTSRCIKLNYYEITGYNAETVAEIQKLSFKAAAKQSSEIARLYMDGIAVFNVGADLALTINDMEKGFKDKNKIAILISMASLIGVGMAANHEVSKAAGKAAEMAGDASIILKIGDDQIKLSAKTAAMLGKISNSADVLEAIGKLQKKWPWKSSTRAAIMSSECTHQAYKLKKIVGGNVIRIRGTRGESRIGRVLDANGNLVYTNPYYHDMLRIGDWVFDRLTGPEGMHIDDYKNLFPDGISHDFSTVHVPRR